MKKENIFKDISESTENLLDMARESSFNNISNNCLYIISEIKNHSGTFFDQNKIRKAENYKKMPKSLAEIVKDLEILYPTLYDVNLYVYKASKHNTVIEVQYFPRTSLDAEFQKKSSSQETILHCKVAIAPYCYETKEKFDINWQLDTFNHKWKMFWWQRKAKHY